MKKVKVLTLSVLFFISSYANAYYPPRDCPISWNQLKEALDFAQAQANGGFGLDMWGTVVNKDGRICAVYRTGGAINDQWLMSRVISMTKAHTAATLSNNAGSSGAAPNPTGFGFTTGGLYLAVQPGGPLNTLHQVSPVNTYWAYYGYQYRFGTRNDPAVSRRIGGVNTFGGGVPLFDKYNQVVGGLGVSGDTSCADENIALRTRSYFVGQGWAQGPGNEAGIDYAGGYPDCAGGGASAAFYNANIAPLPQRFP